MTAAICISMVVIFFGATATAIALDDFLESRKRKKDAARNAAIFVAAYKDCLEVERAFIGRAPPAPKAKEN